MKFRTEIDVKPFSRKIGYGSRILAIGSCFADNMANAMLRAGLHVAANPAGVLFNPASIARTLDIFEQKTAVTADDLTQSGSRFFDYRFHGSLAGTTAEEALKKMNEAVATGHKALMESDTAIITFGTAWVYILNATGEVAANCHKQPAALFTRRRLSADEIVGEFSRLLQTTLADKFVIFTVSPVRHLGDGADENFLSKATLKLAVAELVERYDNAVYFPAYEILNDDLRDYRFYADDLVHPSSQAVEYIREKFFGAALDALASEILPKAEKVVSAAGHRPSDPRNPEYRSFCRAALEQIDDIEKRAAGADFSAERAYFTSMLQ